MEKRTWLEDLYGTWSSVAVFLGKAVNRLEADLCVPIGLTLISALLLLLSSLLALHQRCKFPGQYSGETANVFYSLVGNICSVVGAILSRDLHLQVLMSALAATVDAVHCMVCCIFLSLCFKSKTERRQRMMKRWKRRHLLALSGLMMFGRVFLNSGLFHSKAYRLVGVRNLLYAPIQVPSSAPFMDKTEMLGYILGLLSCAISCTSRFPAFWKACRGLLWMETNILSILMSLLAGVLYTTAILLYDTKMEFLIRVMPWLLSSIAIVVLELLILVFHWCKSKDSVQSLMFSSDTESCSEIVVEQDFPMEGRRKWPGPSQISAKEEVEFRPLNRLRQMTRSDSFSTDTSCDSSPGSSNLEWDIEAANAYWREPAPNVKEHEFSEQKWLVHPEQTT